MSGSSDQLGLPLWQREHDLPPRWDGLPVQWGQWGETAGMFICGRSSARGERCGRCKSAAAPQINLGRIWTDPRTAPPAIARGRLSRGRHLVCTISAFRCADCGHDTVLDGNGVMWDLDDTDYAEDGSWDHGDGASRS